GAEKKDGIWKMPLPDLAEHLEPTKPAPQIPSPPVIVGQARRRRAVVMTYWRYRFWADVARALGDIETANELDARAQDLYDEQVREYLTQRAERRRSRLAAIAAEAETPVAEGDPQGDL